MKNNKLVFGLACLITLGVISVNVSLSKEADATNPVLANIPTEEIKTTVTEFTPNNNYMYTFDKAFDKSPDTMEAWIKVSPTSLGGTITGNWINNLFGYASSSEYQIDPLGQLKVIWGNQAMIYTFKGVTFNDGQWHHIAVVRDGGINEFVLYKDGVKVASHEAKQHPVKPNMPMCIGVSYENWTQAKEPFNGKIRQVTFRTGAINEDQVKLDMANENITGENVLANVVLGETWTNRFIKDTSENQNNVQIKTFDKYVGYIEDTGRFDYSFIALPDIQLMTNYNPQKLENQINWIVNSKEELNTQFVMQLGDLSDVGDRENLYQVASSKMSIMDGKVNYTFVPGNHDYDDNCTKSRSQTFYNRYFPYSKYKDFEGFMGTYEPNDMSNSYWRFTVETETKEINYTIICLEFGPRMEVIRWAGRICEMFPEDRVIVTTHAFIDPDGSIMSDSARYSPLAYAFKTNGKATSGTQLYDGLIKRYKNIFLTFSGHNGSDDIVMRTDIGDNGNKITSFLIDAQSSSYKGDAHLDNLAIFKVNENTKEMAVAYYSPKEDKVFNAQNQFIFSFADESNPTI